MSDPTTQNPPPTTTEKPKSAFDAVDFVIFGLFLSMSVIIGIYHAWKSHRIRMHSKTEGAATAEYLMGGRKMPILPIALSLLTTFLSGVTMLGTPAEIYQMGLLFWVYYMMASVVFIISAIFFIPIFYRLRPISIYEYFQHRFSSPVLRRIAAGIFLVNSAFYMAVVLFSPAVALSGVTDVPTWPFILIIGLCCTLYTTIGGLKAVVWTDTLQAAFMYAGVGTLIIKATHDSGGIVEVFNTTSRLNRVAALAQMDLNPAQHNSLWISITGAFGFWMSLYGLNQMALQRYCSLPTLRHANIVVAITVPCFIILGTMACYIGVVMLAYFDKHGGDPIAAGRIKSRDQYVILFATTVLGDTGVPGLPGLFLACLFSSTLSTVSSGMNSMAAVAWEDFFKPCFTGRVSEDTAAYLTKFLVIVFGVLSLGLAFLAGPLGGIIKASFVLMGAIAGPLIGLFFLGVFNPKANRLGAFVAVLSTIAINLFFALGNFITKPFKGYYIPTNVTEINWNEAHPKNYLLNGKYYSYNMHYGNPDVFWLWRWSGYLYPLNGIILVFVIGTIFSLILKDKKHVVPARGGLHALTFAGRTETVPGDFVHKSDMDLVAFENQKRAVQKDGYAPDEKKRDSIKIEINKF